MNKKTIFWILLIFLPLHLHSQNLELVKLFPFDKGFFKYVEKQSFNGNDPTAGGPSWFFFPNSSQMVLYNFTKNIVLTYSLSKNFDLQFQDNIKLTLSLPRSFSRQFITEINSSGQIFGMDRFGKTAGKFVEILFIKNERDAETLFFGVPPYLSGNFLFSQGIDQNVYIWDLSKPKNPQFFNSTESKKWLVDYGSYFGFQYVPGFGLRFGENFLRFESSSLGFLVENLNYSASKFVDEIQRYFRLAPIIGRDSQGMFYLSESKSRVVVIVDPWSKNVAYRKIEKGQYTPLRANDAYVSAFPKAVHPSGDVYLFDASLETKAYQLKRLKNDWWKEFGAENRVVGQIVGNHIPLGKTPSLTAEVNGYNFESEYVWIQEESTKTELVDGKNVPWVRIKKLSGNEGWILKSNIQLPE